MGVGERKRKEDGLLGTVAGWGQEGTMKRDQGGRRKEYGSVRACRGAGGWAGRDEQR